MKWICSTCSELEPCILEVVNPFDDEVPTDCPFISRGISAACVWVQIKEKKKKIDVEALFRGD